MTDCKLGQMNSAASARKARDESAKICRVRTPGLLYEIHDTPVWYTSLVLGIQQCFLALGGLMSIPFIAAEYLCIGDNDVGYLARAMILNSLFFISGIATFLQVTIGTRLPILQGGSFAYLPPALAILALPHNKCPDAPATESNGTLMYNDTDGTLVDGNELWMRRMREIQGAIAIAAVVEVLLGLTGAIGFLTRFIGPLTVAPAIALLGLCLFNAASYNASGHWGIAFFTIAVLILFSQYLRNTSFPVPAYSKRRGWHVLKSNFIKLFPVLIAIVLAWMLCLILTLSGVLPEDSSETGYRARTDIRIDVMFSSPWFRIPYPGQWGLPVVSAAGVVGMIAGVLSSIVESLGDYYACARLSGAPPIPRHATNRGIFIEGVGSVVAGLMGTGCGVTSYSENIAAIAITRVASRRVLQMAAAFLLVVGMIGKFGATLVLIPDPVIGGLFCVMFGMTASVGISNLQHVDLNSSRNLFVIGFSMFMGIMLPIWVRDNENLIDTGVEELDQIIIVLLETSIFVGGAIAAFFDNTLPGTKKERGMINWNDRTVAGDETTGEDYDHQNAIRDVYDLPFLTNFRLSKYVPILPQFDNVLGLFILGVDRIRSTTHLLLALLSQRAVINLANLLTVRKCATYLDSQRITSIEMEDYEAVRMNPASGCRDERKDSAESCEAKTSGLLYQLNDTPVWYTSIFLGIQQCFLALGGLMGVPFILTEGLCIGDNEVGYLARAMILNSLFFISGIATFLQVTIGTRLPILQGGSFSYLPPALAILALPHNKCPDAPATESNGTLMYNDTDGTLVDGNELWMRRMREIQGAIAIAAVVEVLLGLTGAIGFLTRFIGPLTVAPAIALLGLTLFNAAAYNASGHWGIAFFTIAVVVLFSQYLRNTSFPVPAYSKRRGWYVLKSNFIKLFPVLIAIVLAWMLCVILTLSGVLPEDSTEIGYRARTDIRIDVMMNSPWFRIPYPGQWGLPVVSAAGVVGMIAGILSSIIESLGDYYACARLSGAPPIPRHATNRGICIEGLGSVAAGLLGVGSGVTSYSENIGAIAITRVASRRVLQMAAAFLLVVGMIGKFGAILVLIPDPVIGGLFCVMFGMVAAVGLSNLQHVDLNSSRNLFVIGFSMFMGIMLPIWVRDNENLINTGVGELDQIIIVLLETSIFVGGAIAAFFDNTLPGTEKERGMIIWNNRAVKNDEVKSENADQSIRRSAYDLPFSTNCRFSKYIPILPQFDDKRRS